MENFLIFHILYLFDYQLFENIFGKLSFFKNKTLETFCQVVYSN